MPCGRLARALAGAPRLREASPRTVLPDYQREEWELLTSPKAPGFSDCGLLFALNLEVKVGGRLSPGG